MIIVGPFQLKYSILLSTVLYYSILPGEAVAAPSLAVFKARLDGALSTLGWWKRSLPIAGGLE